MEYEQMHAVKIYWQCSKSPHDLASLALLCSGRMLCWNVVLHTGDQEKDPYSVGPVRVETCKECVTIRTIFGKAIANVRRQC